MKLQHALALVAIAGACTFAGLTLLIWPRSEYVREQPDVIAARHAVNDATALHIAKLERVLSDIERRARRRSWYAGGR